MANAEPDLQSPWLVAAWPGMGSVALAAASYLTGKLGGKPIQTIVKREYFEINTVAIEQGVVQRTHAPKSTLFAVEGASGGGRDLLVFTGEAQPSYKGYEFCHEILDLAVTRGAKRIVTFAAMATPVHPTAAPRVFGVASDAGLLPLLRHHDIAVLAEGQISGLNGVLLGAAAERGIEAICLLGELPFFAVAIPNPKASLAVLRAFTRIAGIAIDTAELEAHSRQVERGLVELIERSTQQVQKPEESESSIPEPAEDDADEKAEEKKGPPPALVRRIEELFVRARADRSQAVPLKAALDQAGLFRAYEDRFLDLFKKDQLG